MRRLFKIFSQFIKVGRLILCVSLDKFLSFAQQSATEEFCHAACVESKPLSHRLSSLRLETLMCKRAAGHDGMDYFLKQNQSGALPSLVHEL